MTRRAPHDEIPEYLREDFRMSLLSMLFVVAMIAVAGLAMFAIFSRPL